MQLIEYARQLATWRDKEMGSGFTDGYATEPEVGSYEARVFRFIAELEDKYEELR